ncbi:MAG: response regulator transcription factor [Acidimicrobiales bacterium]
MESPVLSVVVVDDQKPFRLAARAVLRPAAGFSVVGEAANGLEALDLVRTTHPDVVLMDINMPELGGIDATRRIVAEDPDAFVVLCSTYDVTDLPAEVRTSGARAYVHKESLDAATVRRLYEGRAGGFTVAGG